MTDNNITSVFFLECDICIFRCDFFFHTVVLFTNLFWNVPEGPIKFIWNLLEHFKTFVYATVQSCFVNDFLSGKFLYIFADKFSHTKFFDLPIKYFDIFIYTTKLCAHNMYHSFKLFIFDFMTKCECI